MCHLVAESIQVYHRPNQSMCHIITADDSVHSKPGSSSAVPPSMTTAPADISAANSNKAAKANDGSRIRKAPKEKGKGKGKEKEKEKEKEAEEDDDWETVDS